MALKTGCKNKKITVVFIYMGFFSRKIPCSVTGAVTGAKRGCTPAENILWGDIQFLGHAKMTCERSLVVLWAGVCELRPELRGGVRWVCCWEYNPI